jgi:two-component system chemotaxis response regulator CheB
MLETTDSSARRDTVVIGASRGGLDALRRLVRQLPQSLDAALLIVMHMAPRGPSLLAEILAKDTALQVSPAVDRERLQSGRIYIAVPDRHLMIEDDRVRLSRGPKESHARPSVDVLFRSAAYAAGSRVIGVVLTGDLDDGTAGLWAIKDRGGVAIVQDPTEAPFPSMPRSAMRHVTVDHALGIDQIPGVLAQLTTERIAQPTQELEMANSKLPIETAIALGSSGLKAGVLSLGEPSMYSCPECHGSMIRISEGTFHRYRCHTGHGFTQGALAQEGTVEAEKSLWAALAQLEENRLLQLELSADAAARGEQDAAATHRRRAEDLGALTERVRLLALDPSLTPDEDAPRAPSAGDLSHHAASAHRSPGNGGEER